MRVLHVTTSRSGGAAIAALRIAEGQRAAGIEAEIIFQERGVVVGPTVNRRVPPAPRFKQRTTTLVNIGLTKDRGSFFSPLSKGVLRLSDLIAWEPDIIHAHNWYNFLNWDLALELRKLGIPMVLTAHDERIMTGGCHYALGCEGLWNNCPTCPQSRLDGMAHGPAIRLHQSFNQLGGHVAAPSEWLTMRLAKRFDLDRVHVSHIPNCLSPELFSPPEHPRTGVVAMGTMTGKAPQLLADTIQVLVDLLGDQRARGITLHVAGRDPLPQWPGRIVDHGYLTTDQQRTDFWRLCDIAIAPTLADNFPNLNLEAIFSGAVPVTCDVGGAGEAIRATGRGLAVGASPGPLASAVEELIEHVSEIRGDAWDAWSNATGLYGSDAVASRYLDFYQAAIRDAAP